MPTPVVKYGMKLLIHSQTSVVQPLEVLEWISNFNPQFLMDVHVHTEIKVNPCL